MSFNSAQFTAADMKQSRTIVTFLAELREQDKTLTDWAIEQQLPVQAVYRVVNKRSIGRWGSARKVLRAMGVEPPAITPERGAGA